MRYLSFMILLFLSCGSVIENTLVPGKQLPQEWGKDFKISYYDGGGMVPYSINIDFSYDSCRVQEYNDGNDSYFTFAMTEALRNTMLEFLREQKVLSIRSKRQEGVIYDKGTTSICITQQAKEHCISDGSSTYIEKADWERFAKCYNYIVETAMTGLEPQRKTLTVKIGHQLIKKKKSLSFGINNTPVRYYNENQEEIPATHSFRILPGRYQLNANLTEKGENGSTVYLGNFYEPIELTEDKTISIDYKNNELKLEQL